MGSTMMAGRSTLNNQPEDVKTTGNAAWTRDPVMTTIIYNAGTYIYVGEAVRGTATSAAGWLISRTDNTGDSKGTTKQASNAHDQIWDNYASLTYL